MKKLKSSDVNQIKLTDGLYAYTVHTGKQRIELEQGDSAWLADENGVAVVSDGQPIYNLAGCACTVVRGYNGGNRQSDYSLGANLPYVNGCSTGQLLPATRLGDPTMQLLHMPKHTSEQVHHIHSTDRVVYVLSGQGECITGTSNKSETTRLVRGDVLILPKMQAHHFQTADSNLTVVPLHIFSSTQQEFNHPMFNGTHES